MHVTGRSCRTCFTLLLHCKKLCHISFINFVWPQYDLPDLRGTAGQAWLPGWSGFFFFNSISSFTCMCTTYRTHMRVPFIFLKPHSWIKDSFTGFICNQPAGNIHIFQKPTVVTAQQFTIIQKKAIFPGKTMDIPDPPEQGAIQYASRLFIFLS